MGESSRLRVFFALWPEAWLAEAWHRQGERLQAECGGRLMRAATLHITLAFIGEVERSRIAELRALGERNPLPRVKLECTQQGWWENKNIVWLMPHHVPKELIIFQHELVQRLRYAGFACDGRNFTPHVTLLRRVAREPHERWFKSVSTWQPNGLTLVESQRTGRGAEYVPLGSWPVAG